MDWIDNRKLFETLSKKMTNRNFSKNVAQLAVLWAFVVKFQALFRIVKTLGAVFIAWRERAVERAFPVGKMSGSSSIWAT